MKIICIFLIIILIKNKSAFFYIIHSDICVFYVKNVGLCDSNLTSAGFVLSSGAVFSPCCADEIDAAFREKASCQAERIRREVTICRLTVNF